MFPQCKQRSPIELTWHACVILATTFLLGCASTRSLPRNAEQTEHHHGSSLAETNTTERFHLLVIPPPIESADLVQVTKLLDEPHAKILCVRLRQGAEFPLHDAPVPVMIQALEGAGIVIIGKDRVHIDDGQFVTLAPKTAHSVVPDSNADLVLLVTQMRSAASGR